MKCILGCSLVIEFSTFYGKFVGLASKASSVSFSQVFSIKPRPALVFEIHMSGMVVVLCTYTHASGVINIHVYLVGPVDWLICIVTVKSYPRPHTEGRLIYFFADTEQTRKSKAKQKKWCKLHINISATEAGCYALEMGQPFLLPIFT